MAGFVEAGEVENSPLGRAGKHHDQRLVRVTGPTHVHCERETESVYQSDFEVFQRHVRLLKLT